MTDRNLETELRTVLGDELSQDLSNLAAETPLAEALGIDSLRALELMAAVEEHFDIVFEDTDLARAHTLRGIHDAILQTREM